MDIIQIMAGNDLRSGRVVYLQADGCWSTDYLTAYGLGSEAEREHAENAGRTAVIQNRVVDPYLVNIAANESLPSHIRERIRTSGPTCLPALIGKG